VFQTLDCARPARAPRQLWALPAATEAHPEAYAALQHDFPPDIIVADGHLREHPETQGDPYAVGEYVDPWGCVFQNIHPGVIGEVKEPLVHDWAADRGRIRIPTAWLTIDRDAINRDCAATECFTYAGAVPRPFEQLQFLRGTAELYMDLLDEDPGMRAFLGEMHALYCEQLTRWAQTEVDALFFMDDWGSQRALLIAPEVWRAYFKPLYADYAQIAHSAGKRVFMHSDGNLLSILPDLIEIGVDALNTQIFCIGLDELRPFAGRITFWGEIDRQHLLVEGTPAEVDQAVRDVYATLWRDGGCIAQAEFGPGARPDNVRQVFESWNAVVGVGCYGPIA
jgi:hypothetical protein